MFLAASFNEMSKNLHVHQKVTLTLPTKQREKNNNYSNIAQVIKKKKNSARTLYHIRVIHGENEEKSQLAVTFIIIC